jgi:hypothetical protein
MMDTNPYQPPQSQSADAPETPRSRRIGWRRHAILATCTALMLSQRHLGFALYVVFIWMAPWLLGTAYHCFRYPVERRPRLINAGIWCLCVTIVLTSHLIMYRNAQAYGQQVVTQIEAYRTQHGNYPASLEEAGINKAVFRKHLGLGAYMYEDGHPSLFYASTYVPFDTESYDFTRHIWVHLYD